MPRAREGRMRVLRWQTILVGLVAALAPGKVCAQGTSGPSTSDSRVGYIDSAIPGTYFRFRFDDTLNNVRPTRAEFFYPQGAPGGPGLPNPEPSVSNQDLSAYMEYAPAPWLSVFLEVPFRFLEPTVNPHHAGFSDVNTGLKWAVVRTPDTVASVQFRVYAPTGNSHLGLGTHHVSLEPAFLLYHRLTDRLAAEAELRTWVPVGGTSFAGDIVRYGVGLNYYLGDIGALQIAPVVEVVGWTVLNGKTALVTPDGTSLVEAAGGQTIINAKLGVRTRLGPRSDLYTGYGRPLTGNRWYENTFRVELRLFY
jgi:hypothetical protein